MTTLTTARPRRAASLHGRHQKHLGYARSFGTIVGYCTSGPAMTVLVDTGRTDHQCTSRWVTVFLLPNGLVDTSRLGYRLAHRAAEAIAASGGPIHSALPPVPDDYEGSH